MSSFRLSFSDLAFAILLWALMIAKYGYTYGSSDHEELLVYVLFLKNPALYAHDFFVQSLHGSLPNERTVMSLILLPFQAHLGLTIFLFHFFNTLLIILAFIKLASLFLTSRYGAWLAVFISYFVLYNRGLGGVDAYSAAFQTSDLSSMVAAWALLFFLERRYILSSVVLSIATLVHVLVGFDLMAVLGTVVIWRYLSDKDISLRQMLAFYMIYICTAGVYLVLVYRAKANGNGFISNQELFDIMFVFRHPHHFIFGYFPAITKLLFVLYTTAGLLYYSSRSRSVYQFIVISVVILIFYIVAVDYGHWVFVASFQWYKVIQWVKFFGAVAIVAYLSPLVGAYIPYDSRSLNYLTGCIGVLAGVLVFYFYGDGDIAHGYRQHNEQEIKLSIKIKELVPDDAVFIQPFDFTAFKFYAQRSSYIDFKAIAKNQKDILPWYARIQEVYGLDYHRGDKGFMMEKQANEYFDALPESKIDRLKTEGVTHLITRSDRYTAKHKLILAQDGFFVYQL